MNHPHRPVWQDKIRKHLSPTSHQETLEPGTLVVLVKGTDADDQPQWAYAEIPVERFLEFKAAEAVGNYDLSRHGTILRWGKGSEPPPEIVQEMAEKHGCDPHMEDDLEKLLTEIARIMTGSEAK